MSNFLYGTHTFSLLSYIAPGQVLRYPAVVHLHWLWCNPTVAFKCRDYCTQNPNMSCKPCIQKMPCLHLPKWHVHFQIYKQSN